MKKLFKITLMIAVLLCQGIDADAINPGTPASKEACRQAKKFRKEGWKTIAGSLPLENQFDETFIKALETNADGTSKYVIIEVRADDRSYETARLKASTLAKMRIAASLGESVEALIKSRVTDSATDFLSISKSYISRRIGSVTPILECWRERADGSHEVHMTVCYLAGQAQEIMNEIIRNNHE